MSQANIDVLKNAAEDDGPSFPLGMNHEGGTASDTNKMTIPKDTTANLANLANVQGTIAFDTTLNAMVQNDGTGWTQMGAVPAYNIVSPTTDSMTIDEEDNPALSGIDNTFYGRGAGAVVEAGINNTCVGKAAEPGASDRERSTLIGADASGGTDTVSVGVEAGNAAIGTTQCQGNALIGARAGKFTTGANNVYIGIDAGRDAIGGTSNVAIGQLSGLAIGGGTNNVFIGALSGTANTGTGNVYIGKDAGQSTNGSDRLIIENSSDDVTPLIDGTFAAGTAGAIIFNVSSMNIANLPTSDPGGSGNIWNNAGVLNIT